MLEQKDQAADTGTPQNETSGILGFPEQMRVSEVRVGAEPNGTGEKFTPDHRIRQMF